MADICTRSAKSPCMPAASSGARMPTFMALSICAKPRPATPGAMAGSSITVSASVSSDPASASLSSPARRWFSSCSTRNSRGARLDSAIASNRALSSGSSFTLSASLPAILSNSASMRDAMPFAGKPPVFAAETARARSREKAASAFASPVSFEWLLRYWLFFLWRSVCVDRLSPAPAAVPAPLLPAGAGPPNSTVQPSGRGVSPKGLFSLRLSPSPLFVSLISLMVCVQ